jgi:hypothetical protein
MASGPATGLRQAAAYQSQRATVTGSVQAIRPTAQLCITFHDSARALTSRRQLLRKVLIQPHRARSPNRNARQSDRDLLSAVRRTSVLGAWLLQIGDAETSMPVVPATASTCLNARPAAGHGRLRNAARFCAPVRYRRIGTPGELACWAVCGERFCGPGCYVPFVDMIRCRR